MQRTAGVLRSLVFIVLLLAVGFGVAGALTALRVEPPRSDLTALPPLVETFEVRPTDVIEEFTGYGTVRAIHSARVAAEVSGTVVSCGDTIREGTVVSRGEVLLQLDDREYGHRRDQAEAMAEAEQASIEELDVELSNLAQLMNTAEQELRLAGDEKRRLGGLYERDLAAKKELDFATLAYQQARRVVQGYERDRDKLVPRRRRLEASKRGFEAEAAIARLNVERCVIRAPFAGTVHDLTVDLGDRVAPGMVLLTVVDSSSVEIPIQLAASSFGNVEVGAECRIASERDRSRDWTGKVVRIAPVADERTRTFEVYIVVENDRADRSALLPGLFVLADVRGPVHAEAIVVPRSACRDGKVYIVEGDVVRERRVTIEHVMKGSALVTGKLALGDRVVTSHLNRLADGAPVRVRTYAMPTSSDGRQVQGVHGTTSGAPVP